MGPPISFFLACAADRRREQIHATPIVERCKHRFRTSFRGCERGARFAAKYRILLSLGAAPARIGVNEFGRDKRRTAP
jgi:hypothetical protein